MKFEWLGLLGKKNVGNTHIFFVSMGCVCFPLPLGVGGGEKLDVFAFFGFHVQIVETHPTIVFLNSRRPKPEHTTHKYPEEFFLMFRVGISFLEVY